MYNVEADSTEAEKRQRFGSQWFDGQARQKKKQVKTLLTGVHNNIFNVFPRGK